MMTITLQVEGDEFVVRDCVDRLAKELQGREVTVHSCTVEPSEAPALIKKGKKG